MFKDWKFDLKLGNWLFAAFVLLVIYALVSASGQGDNLVWQMWHLAFSLMR